MLSKLLKQEFYFVKSQRFVHNIFGFCCKARVVPTLKTSLPITVDQLYKPNCTLVIFLSNLVRRSAKAISPRISANNSYEMAESATEIPIVNIEEAVRETVQNVTGKPPTSIEGIAIAYLSLVIMAVLPIFFGAFRSVKYLKEQKVSPDKVY